MRLGLICVRLWVCPETAQKTTEMQKFSCWQIEFSLPECGTPVSCRNVRKLRLLKQVELWHELCPETGSLSLNIHVKTTSVFSRKDRGHFDLIKALPRFILSHVFHDRSNQSGNGKINGENINNLDTINLPGRNFRWSVNVHTKTARRDLVIHAIHRSQTLVYSVEVIIAARPAEIHCHLS